ncbi:hypothetical protein LOOC260_101170 [Paucilactobacillus hokkaidonensis JCM 18461]|uniref:PLD phosphodiesterase domain-containing protein n=1 Tax=Paucilactobacillus hokkaidonensis JCM 18461 TaxID=1291742 RepID=A0A0A1GWF7_9LACO|nr:phospholipase D family protein [Paucilactobacillus hokkaidonensis]BAP84696.1 hypothetical protein LOOC260_101170 [Paucilactobacillus hokkaidonensis JCM 18461]
MGLITSHVIYNDENVDWSIEDIFDVTKFDQLLGVTYSVSAKFIQTYLEKFEQTKLVVGINNESVQKAANGEINKATFKNMMINVLKSSSTKLFDQLDDKSRNKVINHQIELKVPSIGYEIHSKFYLLKNSETGATRTIIGSANLSQAAFDNSLNQFEEIFIFDDSPLYANLTKHFEQNIAPILTDYFPNELFKVVQEKQTDLDLQVNFAAQGDANQISGITVITEDDLDRIKSHDVLDRMEDVQGKIQLGLLDDDIASDIKDLPEEQFLERNKHKDETQLTETTYKIAKDVISPRSKTPQIVTPQTMKKKITQHLTVKVTNSVNEEVPQRPWLVRKDTMIDTVNGKSGLLVKDALNPDILVNFGHRASLDEIKNSFKNINHLLNNYQKYTVNYNDDYGSRIMETILYAFSAPFISVMRAHARSKEERNDIPQFLFLGGIAGSGKSSLLRILAKMTQVSTKTEDYINYNTILPRGVHNKKSQTITQLGNWLLESNVYPLLIDEIPGEFLAVQSMVRT